MKDTEKTEQEHTPGPWNAGRTPHYLLAGQVRTGTPLTIRSPHNTEEIATVWTCCLPTEANAKLISAAPDMLEALKYVTKIIEDSEAWWMTCPGKGGFDLNIIESAIKKATMALVLFAFLSACNQPPVKSDQKQDTVKHSPRPRYEVTPQLKMDRP